MFFNSLDKDNVVYTNINNEALSFEIGDASIIIDIIRKKIYSYPIRTLVQEYISNAKDACVEANKPYNDILITLPTSLKPEFSIRDYGIGMSDERVREVFVKYGISTKRSTNKQIGCFGIGAKSAWAYTDQFIVETFYKGTHKQYIADIATSNEGRFLLVSESATEEPDGVLIKLSVNSKDIHDFRLSCLRATFTWSKKPKFKEPFSYPEKIFQIDDISIYSNFMEKNTSNMLPCGIYLNANGIPFYVHSHSTYVDISKIQNWCEINQIALVIQSDPVNMEISANRENFANYNYAIKKIAKAYNRLIDYVDSEFKDIKLHNIKDACKKNSIFLALKNNVFDFNHFIVSTNYFKNVNFILKKGYFLKLTTNLKFLSGIQRELPIDKLFDTKMFLSKSEGLIENFEINFRNKKIKHTPILSHETKKALLYGRLINAIIVFKNDMSVSDYEQLSKMLDVTTYIEDVYEEPLKEYRQVKKATSPAPKIKKQKSTPNDDVLLIPFCASTRGNYCLKAKNTFDNLREKLKTDYAIFYGAKCSSVTFDILKTLSLPISIYFANNTDIKKIEKILAEDPSYKSKVVSLCNSKTFISNDNQIIECMSQIYNIYTHKDFWRLYSKYKLKSVNFDNDKILNIVARCLLKNCPHNILNCFPKYIDSYKNCIIKKFLETYSLITYIDIPYNIEKEKKVAEHIQLYMQKIDKDKIDD